MVYPVDPLGATLHQVVIAGVVIRSALSQWAAFACVIYMYFAKLLPLIRRTGSLSKPRSIVNAVIYGKVRCTRVAGELRTVHGGELATKVGYFGSNLLKWA